jgi:hypothetical protein
MCGSLRGVCGLFLCFFIFFFIKTNWHFLNEHKTKVVFLDQQFFPSDICVCVLVVGIERERERERERDLFQSPNGCSLKVIA